MNSLVDDLSSRLVTTISLMFGSDDSRVAAPRAAVPMARPTPHWNEFSSIHFSKPVVVTAPSIPSHFM
jgi:hypothetical protein